MAEPMLRFSIKDFRAIKSANLVLNGITVVAGENGSGKSTISRLLYHVFKGGANFDMLVDIGLKESYQKLSRFIPVLLEALSIFTGHYDENVNIKFNFGTIKFNVKEVLDLLKDLLSASGDIVDPLMKLSDSMIELYSNIQLEELSDDAKTQLERVRFILIDFLSEFTKNKDVLESMSIEDLLVQLQDYIKSLDEKAQEWREQRPLELLENYLRMHFQENPPSLKQLELYEYGVPIIDMENNRLRLIHSVQNAIYIDTPMVVGIKDSSPFDHWNDLNKLLTERVDGFPQILPEVRQFFEEEIIKGKVYFNAERLAPQKFVYQRDDGREFNLLECATGLKSFGIIQMLYYNGHLSRNTLLIIDEPEAHLHPQWIVEYARMMVMLNKLVGIKFFIATHNPDMVSAVRYISENQGIIDRVSFYLAERAAPESYLYIYRDLGTDIDPIFESFNIALERISQYGFPEDEDQEF